MDDLPLEIQNHIYLYVLWNENARDALCLHHSQSPILGRQYTLYTSNELWRHYFQRDFCELRRYPQLSAVIPDWIRSAPPPTFPFPFIMCEWRRYYLWTLYFYQQTMEAVMRRHNEDAEREYPRIAYDAIRGMSIVYLEWHLKPWEGGCWFPADAIVCGYYETVTGADFKVKVPWGGYVCEHTDAHDINSDWASFNLPLPLLLPCLLNIRRELFIDTEQWIVHTLDIFGENDFLTIQWVTWLVRLLPPLSEGREDIIHDVIADEGTRIMLEEFRTHLPPDHVPELPTHVPAFRRRRIRNR